MSHPLPLPLRSLSALLTLLTALALQFWLVPFGIHADLAFAALIAFAFLFDALELVAFILLAVLIINWQPGFSVDIIAFALIPLVVYFIQRGVRASLYVGGGAATVLGLLLLYLVIAPKMIVSSFTSFFLNVIICLIAGQVVLWGVEKRS